MRSQYKNKDLLKNNLFIVEKSKVIKKRKEKLKFFLKNLKN